MKGRITYVERRPSEAVSIERVFRQIAKDLSAGDFDIKFQSAPYGYGIGAIVRNLLFFRPVDSDVYHVTGDIHYITLRLPGPKTVLTIHDLIFLRRRSGFRRYVLKKLFLEMPLRRCAAITVVSQAIKDEIITLTGIEDARITVIENPMIDGFVASEPKPFNSNCPVILHIGTAENKNLPNLIEAVRDIKCKLRIIGRLDDRITDRLNSEGVLFENVSGLDQNQIVQEYRNADVVSFCSTYEGFGLPILEAQAMGKPVITSDLAPMNDVAGDAAALVDPTNPASIAEALNRVIGDAVYRESLIDAGFENVKRFEGGAAARRYADIYLRVLSQQGAA